MLRLPAFVAAAIVSALALAGPRGVGASKIQGAALFAKRVNKTTCPNEPLPDTETVPTLTFMGASLEAHKKKGQAAVFSFVLAHRDVETPHCEDDDVADACCAINDAQFVTVTLQLDPARCATRKALRGLKIRLDGQLVPDRFVSVRPKAGLVTIKRLAPGVVQEGETGYDHTLDVIVPANTQCTQAAFAGGTDAWPCEQVRGFDTFCIQRLMGWVWDTRPRTNLTINRPPPSSSL
jgi:hypothetical protein